MNRKPLELSYGQRAPLWRRRKNFINLAISIAILIAIVVSFQRVSRWYEQWAYRREAARWYAQAVNWSEPPGKLKYTENPADAPNGKFLRSYQKAGTTQQTGYAAFGNSPLEKLPFYNNRGKLFLAASPDEAMLFMHERTTAGGVKRLIAVNRPVFDGKFLGVTVNHVAMHNGDYRVMLMPHHSLDMTGIAAPGQIRVFAGQPDPNDASRFTIPFEANGQKGYIDGVFIDGVSFSSDPAQARLESATNSHVKLRLRAPPVTQPSPSTAQSPGQ